MVKNSGNLIVSAIYPLEELLAYRLPNSFKPLTAIVISREQAERIVTEWREMKHQLQCYKSDEAEGRI
jgi:hypothetical protein